ncbi:hypothetical protein DPMN_007147 [Dreissena polymorpha]|uniref:Uncharacterized protein n=1 Tax=Dreissena polymorpha TaxID=45954 RepID=A0A9D4MWU1_DREPO|nr:hypothetical protein DPMN_007147 [Dreissena polymorpha]
MSGLLKWRAALSSELLPPAKALTVDVHDGQVTHRKTKDKGELLVIDWVEE